MEDSQEKDYNFLGNDTFPNLYDALVYERKFESEYLERQIYGRDKFTGDYLRVNLFLRDLPLLFIAPWTYHCTWLFQVNSVFLKCVVKI